MAGEMLAVIGYRPTVYDNDHLQTMMELLRTHFKESFTTEAAEALGISRDDLTALQDAIYIYKVQKDLWEAY